MRPVDLAAFVNELATVSGNAILPFFRTAIGAENKAKGGAFDPVTEADKAGEAAMRQLIRRHFPAHGIIGEEFGAENPEAEFTWVLDPIDGTRSFMCGIPMWGTLIGLQRNGHPVYGLMHQPFTRERFFGDGEAATWRGFGVGQAAIERKLRARSCGTLKDATLMTTSPHAFPGDTLAAFRRVEGSVRLSRYGCDCYAYCMLAAGQVDLVVEAGLHAYDIAALIPIITGAGGLVTTWDGGNAARGGAVIAAGDKRVHAAAVALLA
ncbi:MAG: histidinol-phosphatase [Methylobacteriaceae bacterium]|nr:histidinol-phosphatase [Methylobacteriaceae bacterium]